MTFLNIVTNRAKKYSDHTKLYCFSPEVMLATFVIEFLLALIVYVQYKMTPFVRTCLLTLVALGTFQLAEYLICEGNPGGVMIWANIGFVAITLLPALGLHLVILASKGRQMIAVVGYLISFSMIAVILASSLIESSVCGANYVIFIMNSTAYSVFTVYYLGLLVAGIIEAVIHHARAPKLLFWIVVGYLSFMLPTGIVYLLSTSSRNGGTSIMCGFAVFLALIIYFKILTIHRTKLTHKKGHRHVERRSTKRF